ncbi:NADH dehydrogenase [ubiquinone] 1 alpha subcomplex subunit 8-like [Cydia fagiglandana]|uniref:NADH dehydrogenase [ubiquinone] 1 alpha subcomplex subunit 8-like n=1 Tax=Cydia fagiglandana TaxID=1458189 RepID=UPI002FEDFDA8
MVITKDVTLPECDELTVQEINLSTPMLMSAAPYLGKLCENLNNEFMLCRQETQDPRACVDLGKRVTFCALKVFRSIKAGCSKEFNQYAECIDKSSGDFSFEHCRKTQAVFDKCMKDQLCVDRPDFGYFCRGRVHKSSSEPLPGPPCPCVPRVKDPTPSLPDSKERKPARFGSRFWWMTE